MESHKCSIFIVSSSPWGRQLHLTYGRAPDRKWPLHSELWVCRLVQWLPWREGTLVRHWEQWEKQTRSKVRKKWNVRTESSSLQVKIAIKCWFSHQYESIDYKLLIIMWLSLAFGCSTVFHSVTQHFQRFTTLLCFTVFPNVCNLQCFMVCRVVVFHRPGVLLCLACTVSVELCCLIFWFREYCVNNVWLCVCVAVIIMCMSSVLIGGEDQRELLLAALDMGMVSDGYVFIPYDALLYAMPYQVTEQFMSNHIDQ